MFNFSKKNVQCVYQSIIYDENLPQELECYRDILRVICSGVNYSPELKNIIVALALVTKNDSLIGIYLDKLKTEEDKISYDRKVDFYKNIYDTRIDFFDINDSYLKILLERFKNDFVGGNKKMWSIDNILYGLSTDYDKLKTDEISSDIKREIISFWTIDLLVDRIILGEARKDEFENIDWLVNLSSLNRSLAFLMCSLYDDVSSMKDIYKKYISSFGKFSTPLSVNTVFIRELIIYTLSSEKIVNINVIKKIIGDINSYFALNGEVSPVVLGFCPSGNTIAKQSYFDAIVAKEIASKKDDVKLLKVYSE